LRPNIDFAVTPIRLGPESVDSPQPNWPPVHGNAGVGRAGSHRGLENGRSPLPRPLSGAANSASDQKYGKLRKIAGHDPLPYQMLQIPSRKLGPLTVSSLGLGCMNLNHAYGTAPSAEASAQLLLHALESGVTLFDTSPLYGAGENEKLLGNTLARRRTDIVLATKAGL